VRRPVRVLIADEIGLGKTISAIAVAKYLQTTGEAKRILIIVPRILLPQWLDELDGMGIADPQDIERNKLEALRRAAFRPGFYIGSIDLLKRDEYIQTVSSVNWDLIIIDEAHKMSVKGSKKTIRYNEVGGKLVGSKPNMHAIFLSATPHKGDPEDYISRLKLLDPMLGSPRELDRRDFYIATHEVLFLRRTKEDINNIYEGREIFKPATFFAVALPATDEEREFSEKLLDFMRTKLNQFAERGLLMNVKAIPLVRALLFKRASSSPKAAMLTILRMLGKRGVEAALNEELLEEVEGIFEVGYEDYEYEDRDDPDQVIDEFIDAISDLLDERDKEEIRTLYKMAEVIVSKGDTKVTALLQMLEDFVAMGDEKVIVFTEYKDTLNYIKARILEAHPDWNKRLLSLSAQEAHDKTVFKNIRNRFEHDQNCRILLATDVAAEGLNLQVANLLVNYEVPWSTVKLEQRIGRVWRLGQKKEVSIYTLFLGNRSDRDALDILYRKLLNMRRAQIAPRPLMGQEVLVLQTGAEEVGKVPMAVAEGGKKFKRVTERTLIDAYLKGGGLELREIVRSIIAAKVALQDEVENKSVFYRVDSRRRLEERLELLGFRDVHQLISSMMNMFRSASQFYGYRVNERSETRLKVEPPSGMPMVVNSVNEIIDILSRDIVAQAPTPILVSYGSEEETISVYSVEVHGETHALWREPIGISSRGVVLRGKKLLDAVSQAVDNLVGVTDSTVQKAPELSSTFVANGPNKAQDSARRLLDPVENYLRTLSKLGLRNAEGRFLGQGDLSANMSLTPIGVVTFVKKPVIPLEEIPLEVRVEAERRAVEMVLEVERAEGRVAKEIPLSEQKTKHYDIYSANPETAEVRLIEVKGHMGPEVYGELTDGEAQVARNEGDRYWLCIVYDITRKPNLLRFANPFNTMNYRVIEKITKETRYVLWPKPV